MGQTRQYGIYLNGRYLRQRGKGMERSVGNQRGRAGLLQSHLLSKCRLLTSVVLSLSSMAMLWQDAESCGEECEMLPCFWFQVVFQLKAVCAFGLTALWHVWACTADCAQVSAMREEWWCVIIGPVHCCFCFFKYCLSERLVDPRLHLLAPLYLKPPFLKGPYCYTQQLLL